MVLPGNANQREKGVTARIGQVPLAMRCRVAISLMAQTGQSEAIHSPDECARTVVRLTMPAVWSIAVVRTVANSCCPKTLRTMSSPLDSGA